MSKGGSSTTTSQPQIPEWLSAALKPLLSGAAGNLSRFSQQGQNVLQGVPYNEGVSEYKPGGAGAQAENARGNFWDDPRVQRYIKQGSGGA